jgi:Phage major capsid protein E
VAILWDAYVSPGALTAFVRQVPLDQAYILNQILPDRYDNVLEAEFADSVVTTRAAKARAWDAPPMPGRRDSFTMRKVKLPAISQFMARGERDRLELERLRSGGQATQAIERAIYDDAENNARSVLARVEMMRGDVLADGKVTLVELGGLEADFGVPGSHIVTAATPWTTFATADILGDLRAWSQVYRNTNGFNPGGMIVSTDVAAAMFQNQAVREIVAGFGGPPPILAAEQFNSVLAAYGLPQIRYVYDAQVTGDDGNPFRILPADKAIFLPPAGVELGYTQWGMSATALELQNAGVQVLPSPAGMVAVVDKDVRPPYREAAYVDATCMPILSRPSALFVADVAP